MKPWQFRQKTIGYGISREFFLTVLSGAATLPILEDVVNPAGSRGAVKGYLVPLSAQASKNDLQRPLERGHYALSTLDRKTVMRVTVIPKEEAGFDPGPFMRSERAMDLTQEHRDRMSATWSLIQFMFESHDPMVHASVVFLLECVRRLADLTGGVIADPMCETYRLPQELRTRSGATEMDVQDVVKVWSRPVGNELHVYAFGLRKFQMPEFEIHNVPPELESVAQQLLYGMAMAALAGKRPDLGGLVGSPKFPLEITTGEWPGVPTFELIPMSKATVGQALEAWREELA